MELRLRAGNLSEAREHHGLGTPLVLTFPASFQNNEVMAVHACAHESCVCP